MRFIRCEQLIGVSALNKLKNSAVAVFGIGGVGGMAAEALARSGVEKLALIDKDVVDDSNINRQIIALENTVGCPKTEVMKERVLQINPCAVVETYYEFFLPENADFIDLKQYDYVIDAMDNVTAKIELIKRCKESGVAVISAMGAGNKLDPTKLKIDDITKTEICPLARIVRRELAKRGIKGVKVAYSTERPKENASGRIPASMMPVPASMGLMIASEIIKDITGINSY